MRAYKDLREFLSVLEQERQLLRIHDQVMPEPDLAAAACALTEVGEESPAIYLDNIAGYSSARVALNVHGSWCNHALALDMEKDASSAISFLSLFDASNSIRAHWSALRARPGRSKSSTRI
jgi:vanillate/4-hydroxybenzoate decarboxylase subunit C